MKKIRCTKYINVEVNYKQKQGSSEKYSIRIM